MAMGRSVLQLSAATAATQRTRCTASSRSFQCQLAAPAVA